jgi:hypothetical protein
MPKKDPQNEKELAAYSYAHRDELDNLEEVPSPPRKLGRPSKGLSATITVRFTPDEAQIIYGLAQDGGVTLSDVVREAVRELGAQRASATT